MTKLITDKPTYLEIHNRPGMFKMSRYYMEKKTSEYLFAMGHFLILKAEFLYHENMFCYFAYSALFDELPPNSAAPEYELLIDESTYTLKANKK